MFQSLNYTKWISRKFSFYNSIFGLLFCEPISGLDMYIFLKIQLNTKRNAQCIFPGYQPNNRVC